MKNGTCTKCSSNNIIKIEGGLGTYENSIPIGLTIFSSVKVTRYVCGNCGFMEEWIDNKDDIEKLKKRYISL